MLASVIIPTHNRSDALAQTLERLSRQQFDENWEVIVVNNNCTDDTDEVVRRQEFSVPLKLVHRTTPGEVAHSRNAGARAASGEYLIFIDNDILVEPDFVGRHLRALRENPNCWIVGTVTNLPEQETSPFGQFRKSLAPPEKSLETRQSLIFSGANCSLPRRDFERLGGFDEGFHIASGEDQEFAMRARKQLGIITLFAPSIVAVHNDWAGWTFADFCRRQRIYANTDFYFWRKYGDEHPRLQMLLESLPIEWREDSLDLKMRKLRKQILGNEISQQVLLQITNLLEKSPAWRPFLWQFYKLRLAGAINRGLQEGRNHYLQKK